MLELPLDQPAAVNAVVAVTMLRELEYEKRYLIPNGVRAPRPTELVRETQSPLEQLLRFAALCRWVLSLSGGVLDAFSEFDEPNAVATDILSACKPYVNVSSVAPHKIRSGCGDTCCALLVALCGSALEKMSPEAVSYRSNAAADATAAGAACDEEDDGRDDDLAIDDAIFVGGAGPAAQGQQPSAQIAVAAGSAIAPGVSDARLWEAECLRADALLAASRHAAPAQDWRRDIQLMSTIARNLGAGAVNAGQALTVVSDGISKKLERVTARETLLNTQIGAHAARLNEISHRHAAATQETDAVSRDIATLTNQLTDATERMQALKAELAAESQRLSDSSAVQDVRAAIAGVTTELRHLDLQMILTQQRLFSATRAAGN